MSVTRVSMLRYVCVHVTCVCRVFRVSLSKVDFVHVIVPHGRYVGNLLNVTILNVFFCFSFFHFLSEFLS